jgi:hypothetical protein
MQDQDLLEMQCQPLRLSSTWQIPKVNTVQPPPLRIAWNLLIVADSLIDQVEKDKTLRGEYGLTEYEELDFLGVVDLRAIA